MPQGKEKLSPRSLVELHSNGWLGQEAVRGHCGGGGGRQPGMLAQKGDEGS